MIRIIVGIPGAGKTLYAVSELREKYKKENRQVYYYNIPNLNKEKLGWIELDDPTTWHTLPEGSAIIIDEAHEVFKKDNYKDKAPEHIAMAATLRHRGHDLNLLTQHPVGVDKFLRDRCGSFIYLRSPLTKGSHAFKYEWSEYQEKYRDDKTWSTADEETWQHRSDAFEDYKSAELHTKKKQIPKTAKRVFIISVVALVFGGFIFTKLYNRWVDVGPDIAEGGEQDIQLELAVEDIQETIENYYAKFIERIPGAPHTAPVYDKVTEVKTYPKLICISSKTRCMCHTQQATIANVDDKMCRKYVENGYFDAAAKGET